MINRRMKNKRGQFYIIAVIIAVIFALVSSFIIINFMSSEKSKDEYLGVYESGMIDAILEGDKALIYLEQTAKYASNNALQEYSKQGAVSTIPENGEEEEGAECGSYVYNLWNSESEECFPHTDNPIGEYISNELNNKLSVSQDINFQKKMTYEYFYEENITGTILRALSDDKYIYPVFKSKEYKERDDVKEYVAQQQKFSDLKFPGTFIWPVPGYTTVSSCFGYRGKSSGGTTYHAGLDIGTGGVIDVKAIAAAGGKIESLDSSRWGRVVIDHGGGFKTEYLHLDSINSALKVGDTISQGEEVGKIGGRGPGGSKAYPIHLHFSLINDNVDPSLNYKGAPAVKSERWGNKNINPTCFMQDAIKQNNIQFNTGSLSCTTELRDSTGTIVDPTAGTPFRFCGLYNNLMPQNTKCQTTDNTEWKITNIQVSQKEVSADKTIKITTTIENPSKECASVTPAPIIKDSQGTEYIPLITDKFDVYMENSGQKYKNIDIECTFITDKSKLSQERGVNKCVLLAPTDGSKMKYTITAGAVDDKARAILEKGKTVEFEVSAPQVGGVTPTANPVIYPVDDFMKRNYAAVKKNMEKYKVIESVIKFSQQHNVPSELILGKMSVESSGIPGQKTGEAGLGGGLGQTTFSEFENAAWAKPVRDKGCKVENFLKTDSFSVDCQVETAILHLLDKKRQSDNDELYENIIKNRNDCKQHPDHMQLYLSYPKKSWERALRTYNGLACGGKMLNGKYIDYSVYVGKVMGYASLWGYSGVITQVSQYQQVAIDEIEGKGIIGRYYIHPSFTVNIPFDLSLIDNLSMFMNQTVNDCRISPLGKKDCLNSKIAEFNNDVGVKYKNSGVHVELSGECDESSDEKSFNEFIESVEDCALSPDFDCQCVLKKSSSLKINIDSAEESSLFNFEKSGINHEVTSYNKFLDANNDPLKLSSGINSISLYKKLGYLKSGTTTYPSCNTPKSRFRLCLKTDYKTKEYDGRTINYKNVTLKFSVTIKDNTAPPPITGLTLWNMPHARNSVIVMFDESKENGVKVPDVASYIIYMSDIESDFNDDISTIKNNAKFRTLDVLNSGYEKIQGFDITKEPECEIINNQYCKFVYNAKDKDGNDIKLELAEDKLYYLIDEEKFFYVLNGTDSYNGLNSGREKFIAVTAVDTDSNEIDNVNVNQTIILGENLMRIVPVDNLEPGFVTTTSNVIDKTIHLTYDSPKYYINGEPMDNSLIIYKVYGEWDCLNNNDFCSVKIPFNRIAETESTSIDIDKDLWNRIGIIPVITKNNLDAEYKQGFTVLI